MCFWVKVTQNDGALFGLGGGTVCAILVSKALYVGCESIINREDPHT